MGVMTDILIGAVGSLVAVGVYDCLPQISRWIVGRVTARLPRVLRERYSEEWLAYLNDWDGNIGKFFAAVGFVWTSQRFLAEWHKERDPTTRSFMKVAHYVNINCKLTMWLARNIPFVAVLLLVIGALVGKVVIRSNKLTWEFVHHIAEQICATKGQSNSEKRAFRLVRIANIVKQARRGK